MDKGHASVGKRLQLEPVILVVFASSKKPETLNQTYESIASSFTISSTFDLRF
jgi:hypothetical protein